MKPGIKNILSSTCRRCGGCCRYAWGTINEGKNLLNALSNKNVQDRVPKEMRIREIKEFLQRQITKKEPVIHFPTNKQGKCIFLASRKGNTACSVYEFRPEVCREYPVDFAQHPKADIIFVDSECQNKDNAVKAALAHREDPAKQYKVVEVDYRTKEPISKKDRGELLAILNISPTEAAGMTQHVMMLLAKMHNKI